jgi:D-erythronate 2-dehydrogenase
MKVLITGGAGFLGQRLAKLIADRGTLPNGEGRWVPVEKITLFDRSPADTGSAPHTESVVGELGHAEDLKAVLAAGYDSVFHLAAVVSGQAEQDFDLGMHVNVDALRLLLDLLRASGRKPRFIFASSVAVYGGALPDEVSDSTALLPMSSYGTQKAIGELLVHDYSRKGFIDGRVARLPTITVRPGRPNQAASSFVSSVFREPIQGERAICPVDPDTQVWISSPEAAVHNLMVLHDIASADLGPARAVNLPGLNASAQDMVDALGSVCGPAVAARVDWQHDQRIQNIVGSWPRAWNNSRALQLGMKQDATVSDIVKNFAHAA